MKEFYNNFKEEIAAVNNELIKDIPQDIMLLRDVFNHIFSAGGKRLRPLLTLSFARQYIKDSTDQSAIFLAAAVELIHTATLLHDDVIDNAIIRRNISTANNIWDNKTSILVGDNMFSKAFQLIVKSNKIKAFKELADAAATISSAEVWQIQILNKINITIDEYIHLVTNKTAVLFSAACAVGAICADGDINIAREFGMNFGILYQIKDDFLDYFGDKDLIGKDIFQDIREGKVTLPLIMLLSAVSKDELSLVTSMIGSDEVNKNLLMQLMKKYDVQMQIIEFSKKYKDIAMNLIGDNRLFQDLLNEISVDIIL